MKNTNGDSLSLFDIAWASKKGMLAAAGKDGNIYLCSPYQTTEPLKRLGGINAFINNVAWSPDETLLSI